MHRVLNLLLLQDPEVNAEKFPSSKLSFGEREQQKSHEAKLGL